MAAQVKLLMTHAGLLLFGALTLWWVASPVAPGQWQSMSAIHWELLLVPCVVFGVAAGLVEALLVRRGWFAVAVAVLLVASVPAWWVCGFFVGDLFGSTLDTTADLLVAALIGWLVFVGESWLLASTHSFRSRRQRQPSDAEPVA